MRERNRAESRKTQIREEIAKSVQIKAGEPIVVGSSHGEELKLKDIQEVGKTRLNNQLDFVVREKSQK